MIRKHRTLALLVGVFAASVLGCASNSFSIQSLGPGDLASLAGTWEGKATGLRGISVVAEPITVTISADGAFTARGGTYTTQGIAQVKDARLYLASGFQSPGAQAPQRVATGVLYELREKSQVRQLLFVSGFGNAMSFSFMVSRPKP